MTLMHNTFCPLVSIITPTYNHEQFIKPCIGSVLGQTYCNWEQLIIDDGSTDNTSNIVSGFRDPRIRYERQANQGPFELAKTYNRALSHAKGYLIAILEGDDFWPPAKLATLVPPFIDADIVLAYGEATDVSARGEEQKRKSHTSRLREELSHSVLFNDPVGSATKYMLMAEGRSLISPSTVVIRRSAIERIGGFQYVTGLPLTDYPTFIELSLSGRFYYLPRTMGYRRRHQDSITMRHGQRIHEMVSSFAMRFLERHHDKVVLLPSKLQEIQQNWQDAQHKLAFSEGRFHLLQRNWSEARTHFRIASKSESFTVRLAASAGFLFSCLHSDIEPLMKLVGRADLRGEQTRLKL